MKREHLHALADGAYQLLGAAEGEERDTRDISTEELRRAAEPLLHAALSMFTMEEIKQLAIEGAIRMHGGVEAAAGALRLDRTTIFKRRRARSAA